METSGVQSVRVVWKIVLFKFLTSKTAAGISGDQCLRLIRTPAHTHASGALHLDVQKRRREDEDMKGVGRRGGICPLCYDTSRDVWKVGEATSPRRRRAAVHTRAPPHSNGPGGRKAAQEGVYLIERRQRRW